MYDRFQFLSSADLTLIHNATMQLLQTHQSQGLTAAQSQIKRQLAEGPLQRNLVVTMALVGAMAGEWTQSVSLLRLTQQIKNQQQMQQPQQ